MGHLPKKGLNRMTKFLIGLLLGLILGVAGASAFLITAGGGDYFVGASPRVRELEASLREADQERPALKPWAESPPTRSRRRTRNCRRLLPRPHRHGHNRSQNPQRPRQRPQRFPPRSHRQRRRPPRPLLLQGPTELGSKRKAGRGNPRPAYKPAFLTGRSLSPDFAQSASQRMTVRPSG